MLLQIQTTTATHDWSQEFRTGTSQHWLVVGACALIIAAWCIIGKRLLADDSDIGRSKERKLRHWIGWFIIISQSLIFFRRFTPGQWDLQDSLPLHMCRWSVWIVAWAMLTLNPKARALTLFWGLGLSTQVFLTPFLKEGHGSLGFWIYWINHVQIVGVGVYDILVLGYRPKLRDLRFAVLAGVGYSVLVFLLNLALGTNYAYLGAGNHEGKSIIDALGPYPWRALWMIIGGAAVMGLVYLFSLLAMTIRTRVLNKPPPRLIESDRSNPSINNPA